MVTCTWPGALHVHQDCRMLAPILDAQLMAWRGAPMDASAMLDRCFPYSTRRSVSIMKGMPELNVPAAERTGA